jgi:RND family efflux transporter MFP subunit
MNTQTTMRVVLPVLAAMALLVACGGEDDPGALERATSVTVTWPETRSIEKVEVTIGRLAADSSPVIAAETAGRVSRLHQDAGDRVEAGELLAELDARTQQIAVNTASAEVRRLNALLENQRVQVARLRNLAQRQSVAQDQLDQAETQVEVFAAQLEEARSRLEQAELNLERTRIVSPASGRIQARLVSEGDFVSAGKPLFELVSADALRAILPLPEALQDQVGIGQPVRLAIPSRTGDWVESKVSEIRPMVGAGSRAIELIVELDNPGGWRSGGSVTGQLIMASREGLVVPPGALVRRPAGTVVFIYDGDNRAVERLVESGVRHPAWVEITSGLAKDEPVVVDGAGFLSDDALLDVQRWLDPLSEDAS